MPAIRALIIDDSSVMRKIASTRSGKWRRSSRRIRTEPCESTRSPNDQGKQQGNLKISMSLSREKPAAGGGYWTLASARNTETGN